MDKALAKYHDKLQAHPAPGSGYCHSYQLGVANLGFIAGLSPETILEDLRRHIPPGSRPIYDRELKDTLRKAQIDFAGPKAKDFHYTPKTPPKFNGPAVRDKLLSNTQELTEADLYELSPVRMDWPQEEDTVRFLSFMYSPEDLIFIGDIETGIPGKNIRTQKEWIRFYQDGGKAGPRICINPLTGEASPSKSGTLTYRGDFCVKAFRYCLVEFDNLPLEDQVRFWCGIDLPVKALVSSGGKSIHAWLDVSKLTPGINSLALWDTHIKNRLYEKILIPLGVDRLCYNASRLSRLPGVMRPETNKFQSVLWLSKEGIKVKP
jgi:hypothetical protein